MTNNSHVTSSSQCIRSHSIGKPTPATVSTTTPKTCVPTVISRPIQSGVKLKIRWRVWHVKLLGRGGCLLFLLFWPPPHHDYWWQVNQTTIEETGEVGGGTKESKRKKRGAAGGNEWMWKKPCVVISIHSSTQTLIETAYKSWGPLEEILPFIPAAPLLPLIEQGLLGS